MSTKTKATKTIKTDKVHACMCGCGGKAKHNFVQGHDQRLKGMLLRSYRADGLNAKEKGLVKLLGWKSYMSN